MKMTCDQLPLGFFCRVLVNSNRDAARAAFFCNLRERGKNQLDLGFAGVIHAEYVKCPVVSTWELSERMDLDEYWGQ